MNKDRVVVAFRKIFDRKPDFNKRTDLITATALVWTLGCMDVNFSHNELLFDLEYGYLFSKQLKINLDEKNNLNHQCFSDTDLEKIQMLKDSLSQYKESSLKEQVLQASACYSCLRTIASEYSVRNEFSTLCPKYENLRKQAQLHYAHIQTAYNEYLNRNANLVKDIKNEELVCE